MVAAIALLAFQPRARGLEHGPRAGEGDEVDDEEEEPPVGPSTHSDCSAHAELTSRPPTSWIPAFTSSPIITPVPVTHDLGVRGGFTGRSFHAE